MSGLGTANDPWEITTITQLEHLAAYVNAGNGSQTAGKYYKLMNDIDYNSSIVGGWFPIGNNLIKDAIFQGNFDGNSKRVSNIWINQDSTSYIGLFGYVSSAHIRNLEIGVHPEIKGYQFVGGLIGRTDHSIIENCYATGNIVGTCYVGGLIGYSYSSMIRNSYAICEVSGSTINIDNCTIGGFVGLNEGTITTSYAGGNVSVTGLNQVGGFAGTNIGTIIDCYATGDVSGIASIVGGFVGSNRESGSITYCYATGDVTTTEDVIGGFIGINHNEAIITNCIAANNTVSGGVFYVNRVAGENTGVLSHNYAYNGMVITPNGGNAGTSATMDILMLFNFYNTGNWYNNISWSIATNDNLRRNWKICDGETLPFLQWEGIDCIPLPPDTCYFNAYGGDGSQGNPYQIYFPCQLKDLATFVNNGNGVQTLNKYFKLMNDIDLIAYSYGEGWDPIGYGSYAVQPNMQFYGNFNGNGKIVTNITINRNTIDKIVGLFGGVSNATIYDLGIEDCDISGGRVAGSLVGTAYLTIIKNCYATGTVTSTLQNQTCVGGLVGEIYNSTLENSYSICDIINGFGTTGGLVGQQSLVGTVTCIIANCYATGNVIGTSGIGGLVGTNFSIIRNCVAANPSVNGSGIVNRIVASGSSGLSNNYAYEDMLVNGVTIIGGTHNNNIGESTPMVTLMSFTFYHTGSNWYNNIPWNIDTVQNPTKIWGICDGETLPFLQWQGFNCSKKTHQAINDEKDYPSERNRRSEFAIYPNPTSSHITISSERHFHTIEIVDFLGKIVFSRSNNENNVVNASGYNNGIYFIRIMTENGTEVQKFVKI